MRGTHPQASSVASTAAVGRKANGLFGIACFCVLGLAALLGTGAPAAGAAAGECANAGAPGAAFLPHCRAWELVSPPDKNGGEVSAITVRTRAAADGSAIQFVSLQGFGDVAGSGVLFEYLAQRSSDPDPGDNGWATHAITPPQETQTLPTNIVSAEPKYQGEFSDDLDTGAFFALTPVPTTPFVDQTNVAQTVNLYRRTDLRTPGAGTYQLLSDCPRCAAEGTPLPPLGLSLASPFFAGASTDFGHVIFESTARLTVDAPVNSSNKLYDSEGGAVKLVGVLPDGSSAIRSVAGRGVSLGGGRTVSHPISADGSRITFTVGSSNGEGERNGEIYARINGRSTVQLNASERAAPELPRPATYWDASSDGSRVFFTSVESLTEDAPSSNANLYMWKQADHDETQSVAVDATGGTFTLSFNSATTTAIPFDATAAAVQSALEALLTVKPGNVSVSGGPGSPGAPTPYEVTFTGDFTGANVAQMSADGSGLTGGAASATATTSTPVENLTLLSVDGQDKPGGEADEVLGVIGASEDGRYVYFAAKGQPVAGAPVPIEEGIYLWHEGTLTYVGGNRAGTEAVDGAHLFDGTSVSLARRERLVTPDGRHLLFRWSSGKGMLSARGGADYDHGSCLGFGCPEFYVYSAEADTLECASCNPSGMAATAGAETDIREATGGSQISIQSHLRPLSADGRYAFFTTAERLVSQDVNGVSDAYVYDTATDQPRLLSSGESRQPSYYLEASADGRDVFFLTRERLSGWDFDTGYDLYDARIDGGFPEPPPPPPSCQGDACQPAPLELDDPTPASSSFQATGKESAARKPRCRKGQRRVKARNGKSRCVKRGSKREANTNRRAGR